MTRLVKLNFIFLLSLLFLTCLAQEAVYIKLPEPEAAVAPQDPTPDVIKLAIYFVEREGMRKYLSIEKAKVLRQDFEAYYIIFPSKNLYDSLIVKVYKRNGYTEWYLY